MRRLSDQRLEDLLGQDAPHGDLTTAALGIGGQAGRMSFAARAPMVLACTEEAARLIELAGGVVERVAASGTQAEAGAVFLTARGPAGSLHHAWKVGQTLVEHAAGIATRARAIVDAAAGVPVACTRKNAPGTKDIAVRAVAAGGAVMHRLGLSETVLVFPEHRVFLSGDPAVWMADLKRRLPEKTVVVEVATVDDAVVFARAGAGVLQLEKFTPDQVRAVAGALAGLEEKPVIAAAGGVHEDNAAAYAAAGAGVLVTSAPFFAKPMDVKVVLERA